MQKLVIVCDFCGTEGEYDDFYDGGELIWRRGEEDELSILFRNICFQCYENGSCVECLEVIFTQLRALARHAEIDRGPARRASEQ